MKKYIRAVCVFLAGIMLTASTACTSEHENALENDEKCTLRFSWWGGDERHAATLEAIELFEVK